MPSQARCADRLARIQVAHHFVDTTKMVVSVVFGVAFTKSAHFHEEDMVIKNHYVHSL